MNDDYDFNSSDSYNNQKIEKRDFTSDFCPSPPSSQNEPMMIKEDFTTDRSPEPPPTKKED